MRKLLVIKPSSLGDILHGLLVVQALRAQRPQVQVTWVARDLFAPLVARAVAVDRVLTFRRRGGVGCFGRLLRELRREHFDAILEMQGLARSGFMALAARASLKLGRTDTREGAGWALHRRVPLPAQSPAHAVDILRAFLPALGLEDRLDLPLRFRPIADAPALPEGSVLLFPESRRPEKVWPHFDALTRRLLASGRPVVWTGSAPVPVPTDLAGAAGLLNLCGQSKLSQLPAIVQQAACVVANDSGPMHLAAALRVPVVGLFGPTDPRRFGPYPLNDPRHRVLQAPQGNLRALEAQAAAAAVEDLLA